MGRDSPRATQQVCPRAWARSGVYAGQRERGLVPWKAWREEERPSGGRCHLSSTSQGGEAEGLANPSKSWMAVQPPSSTTPGSLSSEPGLLLPGPPCPFHSSLSSFMQMYRKRNLFVRLSTPHTFIYSTKIYQNSTQFLGPL